MALTLEQLQEIRDSILQQLSAYAVLQKGDKRLESHEASDLRSRLAAIDAEIAKLSTGSSGYITRLYTRSC